MPNRHLRLGRQFRTGYFEGCSPGSLQLQAVINCFPSWELSISFKSAIIFNEILEQLPKLTEDEKRQLWKILDQQLADEGGESPEFLAELDARIRPLDHGARTYSLDEARRMVRDTVIRARR
jgi:hypothetical protein